MPKNFIYFSFQLLFSFRVMIFLVDIQFLFTKKTLALVLALMHINNTVSWHI